MRIARAQGAGGGITYGIITDNWFQPLVGSPFELDPSDQEVSCRVNGQVRQQGSTRDMVFDMKALLVYVTAVMTLEPGDVLMTGTPSGVSPIVSGDVVDVSVSGVGVLRNPVQLPSV